jgi:hypothetical protein
MRQAKREERGAAIPKVGHGDVGEQQWRWSTSSTASCVKEKQFWICSKVRLLHSEETQFLEECKNSRTPVRGAFQGNSSI